MRMISHEMEAQQNQENRSTVPSGPDIMLSIILPSENCFLYLKTLGLFWFKLI